MKITLILKGNIHRRGHFRGDLAQLKSVMSGAEIFLLESSRPGQAVALAASAARESDYLIAVGGDGTLNEVLNGCFQACANLPPEHMPALGVLAYGSANDFARSLGNNGTVDELITLLQADARQRIDAGLIEYCEDSGTAGRRYFLNAADIGIGAHVVRHRRDRTRLLTGNLQYLRSTFIALRSYRHCELEIDSDQGLHWRGKTLALVAGNGRYFGSGLCVAPGARLDDGQMSVTLVGDASARDFLHNFRHLKRGDRLQHPEASYHQAQTLEVRHVGEPAMVEADGELLGTTPVTIRLLPGAVDFLRSQGQ